MDSTQTPTHAADTLPPSIVQAGSTTAGGVSHSLGEVVEWLRGKIAEAEKTVAAREQMEACWRDGDDKEWADAAKLHPSTAGKPVMLKVDRIKESEAQGRIAAKCRHELEMFRTILKEIEKAADAGKGGEA